MTWVCRRCKAIFHSTLMLNKHYVLSNHNKSDRELTEMGYSREDIDSLAKEKVFLE